MISRIIIAIGIFVVMLLIIRLALGCWPWQKD